MLKVKVAPCDGFQGNQEQRTQNQKLSVNKFKAIEDLTFKLTNVTSVGVSYATSREFHDRPNFRCCLLKIAIFHGNISNFSFYKQWSTCCIKYTKIHLQTKNEGYSLHSLNFRGLQNINIQVCQFEKIKGKHKFLVQWKFSSPKGT